MRRLSSAKAVGSLFWIAVGALFALYGLLKLPLGTVKEPGPRLSSSDYGPAFGLSRSARFCQRSNQAG